MTDATGARRLTLDGVALDAARLLRVGVDGASFASCTLRGASRDDVTLSGFRISHTDMTRLRLHDASLSGAMIGNVSLSDLALRDANPSGMRIDGVRATDPFQNRDGG